MRLAVAGGDVAGLAAALAARAPGDGRIGLLDRLSRFDGDPELHERIERILSELMRDPSPRPRSPPDELLALISAR